MAEPLYAKWEDIEQRVHWAVESVLIEDDPPNGQVEWAQEMANQIVAATMLRLDGYEPGDFKPSDEERP
jgi:hypothetical protein